MVLIFVRCFLRFPSAGHRTPDDSPALDRAETYSPAGIPVPEIPMICKWIVPKGRGRSVAHLYRAQAFGITKVCCAVLGVSIVSQAKLEAGRVFGEESPDAWAVVSGAVEESSCFTDFPGRIREEI